MVAQQQGEVTFIRAAKRRNHRINNALYTTSNAPVPINLRNAGYLEGLGLVVKSNGTYTTAGPTGVDAFGQSSGPIDRVTLLANSVGLLFDVSGFMAAAISAIDANYRFGVPFAISPNRGLPDSFTAAPALAAFANVWSYSVPITLDLSNLPYPLGLYQLALNAQEVQLQLRHLPVAGSAGAPGSCVYTGNPANLTVGPTGQTEVHQRFFDPIAQEGAQPPIGVIHTWRQFRYFLSADGDNEIPLPQGGWYTRLIYQIVTGGAGALAPNSNVLTRLRFMYGSNVTPYDETREECQARQYRYYGANLPTGMFTHDFVEEAHNERDFINSRVVTDLRAVATTSGGTYSGGAYIDVAAEQLIPIDVSSLPVVGAQGVM